MSKKNLFSERVNSPTPNGGVYSIAYFYDKNGNPCIKRIAARIVIAEFDSKDNTIQTTTMVK